MSNFDEQFYYQQPQQFAFNQHAFSLDQHGARREKTPTDSLINHTGLSPGPLTATPPPQSRRTSRITEQLPRDQQFPDQLLWDEASPSNSPTSVRTPDNDSFEVEMLDQDMQTFYHQNTVGMTTQVSNNAIPAGDHSMFFTPQGNFTNQAIDAALQQTLVAHGQQYHQQPQYQPQVQQMNHFQSAHALQGFAAPNYITQPTQHEPWNGHSPTRSSMTPRTGGAIFDAATDPHPVNYGGYPIYNNVQSWAAQFTDPTSLYSPSEQVSPMSNFFDPAAQNMVQQTMAHRPSINIPPSHAFASSPIEQQWPQSAVPQSAQAEPSPDQQGFVNYDASSALFTESYNVADQRPPPSSPGSSSISHLPHSPYQQIASPAAVSPGSSSGVFSFHSDQAMMLDPFHVQQPFLQPPQHRLSIQSNYTPIKTDVDFDSMPESEAATSARNQLAKNGGRALGTHLEPEVAKAAHDMRKISACWHCVLQRDKCSDGEICARCLKRSQRPNADCGLGCIRIKLVELSPYFLPSLVTQMHEDSHLKHFVNTHVHGWGNQEFTLYMTCGSYNMPHMPIKVYEFVPKGNALLTQIQYVTDPRTNTRVAVRKQSPALGMVHINHNEEKTYDKYISDIVEHHLDAFGELCWLEDDNDFLQKLFKLMTRVKPKNDDEAKLLREVFRLIVVTFIMSHALTISEESKHATLSRMHSYAGQGAYTEKFTSPRMTNRQLKYFFNRLQRTIQATVLNKLQQIFKSSKGCDKWLAAFVAVLGMCMALEDQQKNIHAVMSTRSAIEGHDPRDAQDEADKACREIDTRMLFVQQIFRWKYNRKHNPLVNSEFDWEKEVGFGDRSSVEFVRQVAQLVRENTDYLRQQQRVSISHANQTKYSARLVGEFLLSFWLPNAS